MKRIYYTDPIEAAIQLRYFGNVDPSLISEAPLNRRKLTGHQVECLRNLWGSRNDVHGPWENVWGNEGDCEESRIEQALQV